MNVHDSEDDEVISNRLVNQHIWEPKSTKVFIDNIKRGDTVIDAGAHIGYYTILASNLVGDGGRVYAFEPWVQNYTLLLSNLALNKCTNVFFSQNPLWDFPQDIYLQQIQGNTGDVRAEVYNKPDKNVVRSAVLDRLFKPNEVQFIKTDCQGTDYYVLKGAYNLITKSSGIKVLTEPPGSLDSGRYSSEEYVLLFISLGLKLINNMSEEQTMFYAR